jgi:hypothetical protein
VRTSETSVDNNFTRQYIPEDNSEHHTSRRENLKSHLVRLTFDWMNFDNIKPRSWIGLNLILSNIRVASSQRSTLHYFSSMLVLWFMTPCGFVYRQECFAETFCVHLQGVCLQIHTTLQRRRPASTLHRLHNIRFHYCLFKELKCLILMKLQTGLVTVLRQWSPDGSVYSQLSSPPTCNFLSVRSVAQHSMKLSPDVEPRFIYRSR